MLQQTFDTTSAIDSHDLNSPWARHAAQWHLVTTPLRPHQDDVALAQAVLNDLSGSVRQMRALILGVTPELVNLHWPREAEVVAVDASVEMIKRHWSAPASTCATAVHGLWQALPTGVKCIQLVLADGSLNVLPSLQAIRQVIRQTHAVLANEGRFVLRAFTRPEVGETPAVVIDQMLQGRIANVHVAKWRLAMALHGQLSEGVQLHAIWQAFHAACDVDDLTHVTGWSRASVQTIDNYRGVYARYFFPTLPELRALLAETYTEVRCHHFDYPLGERCPTLVLKPQPKNSV